MMKRIEIKEKIKTNFIKHNRIILPVLTIVFFFLVLKLDHALKATLLYSSLQLIFAILNEVNIRLGKKLIKLTEYNLKREQEIIKLTKEAMKSEIDLIEGSIVSLKMTKAFINNIKSENYLEQEIIKELLDNEIKCHEIKIEHIKKQMEDIK